MKFYFNEIFNQFSEEDLKEIDEMPEPTLDQAQTLFNYWELLYDSMSTSDESKIFLAKATAKCVQRCKQIYPELFI